MRLIDADALHERVRETMEEGLIYSGMTIAEFIHALVDEQPTVARDIDLPIKRGRWAIEPGIGCKCSACGFDIGNDLDFMEYVEYCPACGAKMERWE